jgi:hypothetical protein
MVGVTDPEHPATAATEQPMAAEPVADQAEAPAGDEPTAG